MFVSSELLMNVHIYYTYLKHVETCLVLLCFTFGLQANDFKTCFEHNSNRKYIDAFSAIVDARSNFQQWQHCGYLVECWGPSHFAKNSTAYMK